MKNHCSTVNESQKKYYCFQGASLLAPINTPDSGIGETIKKEIAGELFSISDVYSISSLDGSGDIKELMLNEDETPAGWKKIPVRQAINFITGNTIAEGTGEMGRLLRSFHVGQWRRDSRYCGRCGSPNKDAETELARLCPNCGYMEFPRIAPAVITLITNDKDEALLAHNKKFSAGVYSLIAGFNEAGESLETTVEREIREEVGLEVKDICYIKSQPWPFPNSLMLGFSARHAGGAIKADGVEIEDARWFSRDSLPSLPGNGSVSRYLITLWQEGRLREK